MKISNKAWYRYWQVMAFISSAFLVFAIASPTVLFGVVVGSMCLLMALIFMGAAKKRMGREVKK